MQVNSGTGNVIYIRVVSPLHVCPVWDVLPCTLFSAYLRTAQLALSVLLCGWFIKCCLVYLMSIFSWSAGLIYLPPPLPSCSSDVHPVSGWIVGSLAPLFALVPLIFSLGWEFAFAVLTPIICSAVSFSISPSPPCFYGLKLGWHQLYPNSCFCGALGILRTGACYSVTYATVAHTCRVVFLSIVGKVMKPPDV